MYDGFFKRAFDVVMAGMALVLLSPVMLVVALAIRAEDGGPAVFKQRRVGRFGTIFTIRKFRSMPVSTPDVPSAAAGTLAVTRVGRIIRRTNLDELPQLWNIVVGDMSLIGPRPALPSQSDLLRLRERFGISALRPGLTGLAQVNAYDGMPESEKVEWEGKYAREVSFMRDCAIVVRTFGYLLRRPPAY
jgi:O-antigen biosynthesis protein WbqP